MQNLKLNANPVGANCIRPHFEEITLKEQKGITLIALIITIIVMLILVGVTINVALNGGLFTKAEEAATLTTVETEKEQLMMAAIAVWDAETGVDFEKIQLPENFSGSHGTYTNSKSKNTYTIDKATGKVAKEGTEEPKEGLVYEKVYRGYEDAGEEGDGRMDFYMAFSKKYGICLHNYDAGSTGTVAKYTYDEENKTLRVGTNFDEINFTCGVGQIYYPLELQHIEFEQKVTNEDISTVYKSKHFSELDLKEEFADIDVHTGIYYYSNPDTKDYGFYYIASYYSKYYGKNVILIQETGGMCENTFEDAGITILNNKQIQKDGITYTLLETLE